MKKRVHIWMFLLLGSSFLKAESYVIPFRLIQNLIVIEAAADENKGLFILDTGSDAIFLDKSKSRSSAGEQEFKTIQGSLTTESFVIKHFTLGNISRRNLEAYNARMDNLEAFLSLDIAGIVGAKVFSPHSILFDFERNLLFIIDKSFQQEQYTFTQELDFSLQLGVPTIQVNIENLPYTFILDSGASSHMVANELVRNHPEVFRTTAQQVYIESLGSTQEDQVSRCILAAWQLGDKQMDATSCVVKDFTELNQDSHLIISGLLSLANLNTKAVLMDFKKHKVFF